MYIYIYIYYTHTHRNHKPYGPLSAESFEDIYFEPAVWRDEFQGRGIGLQAIVVQGLGLRV